MAYIPSQLKNYPLVQTTNEDELDGNNSLKKQLNLVGHDKRVIDFGCATGYFAQFLKQRGCYVTGVELNPEAAKVAEHHCDQVIVADLDFASVPALVSDQKFEVAVFGDVLEHLRDPWQVLAETRQILHPEGYVIASIPNVAHGAVRLALLQGNFEYANVGLLDNTHLRFFTRKTVQELFERAGYWSEIVDRTIIPLASGSLYIPSVEWHSLSDELIQQVEQAEDADTLQFVVRAFPMTPEGKYAALQQKYADIERKYSDIVKQHSQVIEHNLQLQSEVISTQSALGQVKARLQQAHTELEQAHTELEQAHTELEQAHTELEQAHTELQQAQQWTIAMESSKFWKIRTLWMRLKQRCGWASEG